MHLDPCLPSIFLPTGRDTFIISPRNYPRREITLFTIAITVITSSIIKPTRPLVRLKSLGTHYVLIIILDLRFALSINSDLLKILPGLSIVRYAIAITISKVGQYSIANRFPITISIVRPSQYTIVYWYPCNILNIIIKERHSKTAKVL